MRPLAAFVARYRYLVVVLWVLLAAAGAVAAPRAVDALTYDFSLPGQPGFEANQRLADEVGSGADDAPLLLVVGDGTTQVDERAATGLTRAVTGALPGARIVSFVDEPQLRSADGTTGVVLVYPRPVPGPDAYAAALPTLEGIAASSTTVPVAVTGQDALAADTESGGAGVLAEVLFGAVGALVVLLLVFGSALALMPLVVAAGSILTTFGIVWALTEVTDVSFIVQYLLSLIGLGVAIDYALLIVTRWREERAHGGTEAEAMERTLRTAGRSVLFSGVTVAVSLAALIALPVPFLRSVGFTGLLIPVISVVASITLLPALLLMVGRRLEWPRRSRGGRGLGSSESRLWRRIGSAVVGHRWLSALAAAAVLLALAAPVLGLRLGTPSAASQAPTAGTAGTAFTRLADSGVGAGLLSPVEIRTTDVDAVRTAVADLPGVAGVLAPASWVAGDARVVDVWTVADTSDAAGSDAAAAVRTAAERTGAQVGGVPAQDADFLVAVYGNAPLVLGLIVLVTFVLLATALRSVWLPVKALVLNVISISAAYGVTVLIWQHGYGTSLLFGQQASGTITTWVPIAVFAFLFGLSMDYEVFLLSRIREEYDHHHDTDQATVAGVARTGRLVTSAALILFLAFIALSRVPSTDVKILATALALGIILDATLVRGVLAPALVALLGRANWWWPGRPRPRRAL
ncbi:MMPL family transporter [uncultured Friedmanniella sp.]|uniref:MMPL family transporter n=1 Tax=uncultured Friedmanniella sp. TaxID=335381 RepID=UPI0035CA4CFA